MRRLLKLFYFSIFIFVVVSAGSKILSPKTVKATPESIRVFSIYYVPNPYYQQQPHFGDMLNLTFSVRTYMGFASAFHQDVTKQMYTFDEVGVYFRYSGRPVIPDNDPYIAKKNTYVALMNNTSNGPSICQLISQLDIDQVWLWVDPKTDTAPGSEYIIVAPNSTYGDASYSDICGNKQSFVIMGLDYTLPAFEAVHSFGHFMEALLGKVQGNDLFVGRYRGAADYNGEPDSIPIPPYVLADKCGDVHTPPNVPLNTNTNSFPGYQYGLTTSVNSSCANWNPDGTGIKVPVSAATWRAIQLPTTFVDDQLPSDQLSYLIWWMQNMPQDANTTGFFYNGKAIPSWWSFVKDTDEKIRQYNKAGYWLDPSLAIPVDASSTTYCNGQSGLTLSCPFTTANAFVGQSINPLTGLTYGDIAIATIAYAPSNAAVVSSVSYCGAAMTRIGTGPSNGGGMKTEMWYKLSPQTGICNTNVTFSLDPGERVVSTTILNNINQTTPLSGAIVGGYSAPYSGNPGVIQATSTGAKDSQMICTYSLYSEQTNPPSANFASPFGNTLSLWKYENATYPSGAAVNVWAGLGAGYQRSIANQSTTLKWTTVKTQPASYTCTNVNVKPFALTIPPAPIPMPVPTASTPVVNIKADGLNRLYQPSGSTAVISWTTTGATSCTAYGSWSGSKLVNGSVTVSTPSSGTSYYALQCTGSTGLVAYDQVYVYPWAKLHPRTVVGLEGKMFVNGFDNSPVASGSGLVNYGPFPKSYVKSGTTPTLTWVTNATSCGPYGTYYAGIGSLVMPVVTSNTLYNWTCLLMGSSTPEALSTQVTVY